MKYANQMITVRISRSSHMSKTAADAYVKFVRGVLKFDYKDEKTFEVNAGAGCIFMTTPIAVEDTWDFEPMLREISALKNMNGCTFDVVIIRNFTEIKQVQILNGAFAA